MAAPVKDEGSTILNFMEKDTQFSVSSPAPHNSSQQPGVAASSTPAITIPGSILQYENPTASLGRSFDRSVKSYLSQYLPEGPPATDVSAIRELEAALGKSYTPNRPGGASVLSPATTPHLSQLSSPNLRSEEGPRIDLQKIEHRTDDDTLASGSGTPRGRLIAQPEPITSAAPTSNSSPLSASPAFPNMSSGLSTSLRVSGSFSSSTTTPRNRSVPDLPPSALANSSTTQAPPTPTINVASVVAAGVRDLKPSPRSASSPVIPRRPDPFSGSTSSLASLRDRDVVQEDSSMLAVRTDTSQRSGSSPMKDAVTGSEMGERKPGAIVPSLSRLRDEPAAAGPTSSPSTDGPHTPRMMTPRGAIVALDSARTASTPRVRMPGLSLGTALPPVNASAPSGTGTPSVTTPRTASTPRAVSTPRGTIVPLNITTPSVSTPRGVSAAMAVLMAANERAQVLAASPPALTSAQESTAPAVPSQLGGVPKTTSSSNVHVPSAPLLVSSAPALSGLSSSPLASTSSSALAGAPMMAPTPSAVPSSASFSFVTGSTVPASQQSPAPASSPATTASFSFVTGSTIHASSSPTLASSVTAAASTSVPSAAATPSSVSVTAAAPTVTTSSALPTATAPVPFSFVTASMSPPASVPPLPPVPATSPIPLSSPLSVSAPHNLSLGQSSSSPALNVPAAGPSTLLGSSPSAPSALAQAVAVAKTGSSTITVHTAIVPTAVPAITATITSTIIETPVAPPPTSSTLSTPVVVSMVIPPSPSLGSSATAPTQINTPLASSDAVVPLAASQPTSTASSGRTPASVAMSPPNPSSPLALIPSNTGTVSASHSAQSASTPLASTSSIGPLSAGSSSSRLPSLPLPLESPLTTPGATPLATPGTTPLTTPRGTIVHLAAAHMPGDEKDEVVIVAPPKKSLATSTLRSTGSGPGILHADTPPAVSAIIAQRAILIPNSQSSGDESTGSALSQATRRVVTPRTESVGSAAEDPASFAASMPQPKRAIITPRAAPEGSSGPMSPGRAVTPRNESSELSNSGKISRKLSSSVPVTSAATAPSTSSGDDEVIVAPKPVRSLMTTPRLPRREFDGDSGLLQSHTAPLGTMARSGVMDESASAATTTPVVPHKPLLRGHSRQSVLNESLTTLPDTVPEWLDSAGKANRNDSPKGLLRRTTSEYGPRELSASAPVPVPTPVPAPTSQPPLKPAPRASVPVLPASPHTNPQDEGSAEAADDSASNHDITASTSPESIVAPKPKKILRTLTPQSDPVSPHNAPVVASSPASVVLEELDSTSDDQSFTVIAPKPLKKKRSGSAIHSSRIVRPGGETPPPSPQVPHDVTPPPVSAAAVVTTTSPPKPEERPRPARDKSAEEVPTVSKDKDHKDKDHKDKETKEKRARSAARSPRRDHVDPSSTKSPPRARSHKSPARGERAESAPASGSPPRPAKSPMRGSRVHKSPVREKRVSPPRAARALSPMPNRAVKKEPSPDASPHRPRMDSSNGKAESQSPPTGKVIDVREARSETALASTPPAPGTPSGSNILGRSGSARPLNETTRKDLDLQELLDKMKDPRMGLDIRDRTKGLRTVKRSIFGCDLVDWLITNGFTYTGSRAEAVAIGAALVNTYSILSIKKSGKNKLVFEDSHRLYSIPDDDKDDKETKKSGSKKSKALNVFMCGHAFGRTHNTYTLCMICNHAIWGIGKNCYECNVCKQAVHQKCISKVSGTCPGPPKPDVPAVLSSTPDTAGKVVINDEDDMPWEMSSPAAGSERSERSGSPRATRTDSQPKLPDTPAPAVIEPPPSPTAAVSAVSGVPAVVAATPPRAMTLSMPDAEAASAHQRQPSGQLTPANPSGRRRPSGQPSHLKRLSMSLTSTPPNKSGTPRTLPHASPRTGEVELAALMKACKEGALNSLKQLFQHPTADLALRMSHDTNTPIHVACFHSHADCVEFLLKKDSELVQVRNGSGMTPLHVAAQKGAAACVKLLIEHKSDINARDYTMGQTALHFAAERGHTFCVKLLLDHDADPAIVNAHGKTALDKATIKGHTSVIQLLEGKSQRTWKLAAQQQVRQVRFLGLEDEAIEWLVRKIPVIHDAFELLHSDFNLFDADNDGHISLEELRAHYGGSDEDEDFMALFEGVDPQQCESIDFKEFNWLMYLWCQTNKVDSLALIKEDTNILRKGFRLLEKTFKYADQDSDSLLSKGEVAEILSLMNGISPALEFDDIQQRLKSSARFQEGLDLSRVEAIDFRRFLDIMQAWRLSEVILIHVVPPPTTPVIARAPRAEGMMSDGDEKDKDSKDKDKDDDVFAVLETISLSQLKRAIRRHYKLADITLQVQVPTKKSGEMKVLPVKRSRDLETAFIHFKTKAGPNYRHMRVLVQRKVDRSATAGDIAPSQPAQSSAITTSASGGSGIVASTSTPFKPKTGSPSLARLGGLGLGGLDMKKADEWESPYLAFLNSATRPKYSWEVAFKEIELGETLGKGACGMVYKGTFRGRKVAVKRLHKELLHSDDVLEAFVKEIELMAKLNHPNILEFVGASIEYPNICFMTAFMEQGSMNDVLKRGCSWETKVKMAKGAASGLKFLHELSPPIVHRDVKTFNLLVDKDFNVALGDFGVSEALESEDKRIATRWGTVNWMPPEVFDGGLYDEKSDVFSFGMVLWELLTGQIPFGDTNPLMVHQLIDSGERPFLPNSCNSLYANLIRQCWETDPERRPSLGQIIHTLDMCLLPPDADYPPQL